VRPKQRSALIKPSVLLEATSHTAMGIAAKFAAFVLDLLDFMEERIGEALESEASRFAAVGEAAGAIPVLRDRPRWRSDTPPPRRRQLHRQRPRREARRSK
jgi:hypothetical protein